MPGLRSRSKARGSRGGGSGKSTIGLKVRKLMQDMCSAREGVSFRQVCIDCKLGRNFPYGSGGMNMNAIVKFFGAIPPTSEEKSRFLDLLASNDEM